MLNQRTKTYLLGLLTAIALSVNAAHAQTPVKVFVFAGQSNAQGYGNRLQLNPVPSWAQNTANGWTGAPTVSSDSGFQYQHPTTANFPCLANENNTGLMAGVFDAWGAFQGQSPKYPSGTIGEVSSYGPELSFLRKWQDAHPGEQLAYVKCVLGGSSITEWLPGTNMWNILKATLDQAKGRLAGAGLTPEWSGLCWMQGENGATGVWTYLNPPPGNEYKDQLRAFLAAVRAETSPQMIAVIGRIGNHMLADNIIDPLVGSGINTKENILGAANNRRAQQVLVGGDSGNCWADTDNLPVLQSGSPAFWYHHTGPGYLAMGERFYAAFAGASPPPPPPSPLAVQFNGTVKPDWIVKLNGVPIGAAGDIIEITGTP